MNLTDLFIKPNTEIGWNDNTKEELKVVNVKDSLSDFQKELFLDEDWNLMQTILIFFHNLRDEEKTGELPKTISDKRYSKLFGGSIFPLYTFNYDGTVYSEFILGILKRENKLYVFVDALPTENVPSNVFFHGYNDKYKFFNLKEQDFVEETDEQENNLRNVMIEVIKTIPFDEYILKN